MYLSIRMLSSYTRPWVQFPVLQSIFSLHTFSLSLFTFPSLLSLKEAWSSSWLSFPNAGFTGLYFPTWPMKTFDFHVIFFLWLTEILFAKVLIFCVSLVLIILLRLSSDLSAITFHKLKLSSIIHIIFRVTYLYPFSHYCKLCVLCVGMWVCTSEWVTCGGQKYRIPWN